MRRQLITLLPRHTCNTNGNERELSASWTLADRECLDRRERLDCREHEQYACAPIAIGLRTSDRERELSGMRAEAKIRLRSPEAETGARAGTDAGTRDAIGIRVRRFAG
ncbi:hypothetical protein DY000_02052284 [Brassica cretica]|uniref:Uncharacterized protein n=1 Tax=Brassica cretica TaxID=69181 RepID=A0ABQ7AI30_BRACR|nr:hypothetical protein DY000_02052284 [Brassica cretica]